MSYRDWGIDDEAGCGGTPDDFDDAIIEDTCHCNLCGSSFVLGGSPDYVIVESDGPGYGPLGGQLKLCVHCAGKVYQGYKGNLSAAGICEHGVSESEFCEPCNAEYKRARRENGDDDAG